jgi:hypothetical protein
MPAEDLPAPYDQEDTMEESSFDELAKGLADSTISRSRAIKLMGTALLGGALSFLALPDEAQARRQREKNKKKLPLKVLNETRGQYSSEQVFFAVLGLDSSGQFAHLDKGGNLVPMSVSDNDAANHLTKNGQNYSNYFFTVAEAPQTIPLPNMTSGRIYISLGSPLYIKVNVDADGIGGYAGPDINNPTDPNIDVYFDTIEFTIDQSGFFGNTTQVDLFGFPLRLKLQSQGQRTEQVGVTGSRESVFQKYVSSVPAEFKELGTDQAPYRIIAPKHGAFSQAKDPTYFEEYIQEVWQHYAANQLVIEHPVFGTLTGQVINDVFTFTRPKDHNTYQLLRPQTWEVFAAAGTLVNGRNDIEKAIGAQFTAALNRHVALDYNVWGGPTSTFCDPSRFYKSPPANYYAQFWHQNSINNKAYGFDYDDVCAHSTLLQSKHPKELEVSVGWN